MPHTDEKLNGVLNKIKYGNSDAQRQRSTILLPYHPAEPNKTTKHKTANQNDVLAGQNINEGNMWKINWMIEYDSKQQMLATERLNNAKKLKENEMLKEQTRKQKEMVVELLNRLRNKNTIIQQLVQQCLAKEDGAIQNKHSQTIETASEVFADDLASEIANGPVCAQQKNEGIANEEGAIQNVHQAIKTTAEVLTDDLSTELSDDAVYVQPKIENIATSTTAHPIEKRANAVTKPNRTAVAHQCPNCSYCTDKKSSLVDHMAEFCKDRPFKNMTCNICGKLFTRRGLRVHFNDFTTGMHTPRGEHALYSVEDHEIFKVAAMYGFEYP